MRALRFHGNKDLRVDDIPEPVLRSGWVKVKNVWAGICGSDLHEYMVGPKNAPATPHVLTGETLPSVMGHEFAGTIAELGEGVTDLEMGQKVAVFPILGDGTCDWCRSEVYGLCPKWGFMGYSGYGGGMAQYICVDRKAIFKIPDHVPLDVAALVEPLAVAWHGVVLGNMKLGETALVLGAGPIGLAVIMCLRAHGISKIIVSEVSPVRSAQAKQAGASHVLNPTTCDIVASTKDLAEGKGAHVVFECAGLQATMDAAINACRGAGTIVNIGIFESDVTISPNIFNRHSLKYVGSNCYSRGEFQDVIDAIAAGKIKNPEQMITAKIPLEEGVVHGFETLLKQKDKHVKILLNPWHQPEAKL